MIDIDDKGQLKIDLYELVTRLTPEQALMFADAVAMRDDVIDAVARHLINGWTVAGSHQGWSVDAMVNPFAAVDKARRMVAESSGDTAKAAIQMLTREVDFLRRQIEAASEATRDMPQRIRTCILDAIRAVR